MMRQFFYVTLFLAILGSAPLQVLAHPATVEPIAKRLTACLALPAHQSTYGMHICQSAAIASYVAYENSFIQQSLLARHGKKRSALVRVEQHWLGYVTAEGNLLRSLSVANRGTSLYFDQGEAVIALLREHIRELKSLAVPAVVKPKGPVGRSADPSPAVRH